MPPLILIVMGVSGAGKSTIAGDLARALHWPFQEGDDLHPAANIAKMAQGIPLDDADRAPWLAAIKAWIDATLARGDNGIVTCSALKRRYRDYLVADRPDVRILYLRASPDVLRDHIHQRTGHFMPESLLGSQLATLEEPTPDEHPLVVEIDSAEADTVRDCLKVIRQIRPDLPA